MTDVTGCGNPLLPAPRRGDPRGRPRPRLLLCVGANAHIGPSTEICKSSVGAGLCLARAGLAPYLPGRAHGPALQKCCVSRAGRTGPSAPAKCPVGRHPCVPPPNALHANPVIASGWPTSLVWQSIILCAALCRPRLPFFLRRKKGRKERRQNQGFAILPRLRCRLRRSSLPRESGFAKFVPCFRMVSASPSATRSALVLVWRDGGKPLRLPCGGVRARRPTKDMKACANSVRAVDDAGPPAAHALFHAGRSPPSSEKRNAKPPLLEKATVLH